MAISPPFSAAAVDTSTGLITPADWTTYLTALNALATGAIAGGGSAGGDLSGSYPNPTVFRVNGILLSGLATGIIKNTTGTGQFSIAAAADFPTLNQSTTGNAGTVTNGVYTTDTGTVTNTMLAGSIASSKLANTAVASLSGTNTGDQTNISGTAGNLSGTPTLPSGTSIADPSSALNLANKEYVDTAIAGAAVYVNIQLATTVSLATASGSTVVYNNGSSGVGATLTVTGSGAGWTIDGTSPNGLTLLVKNESTTANNGLYTNTSYNAGTGAAVFTRATNYNTVAGINKIGVVFVALGTTQGSTQWYNTTTMVTIGTTAVTFATFKVTGSILVSPTLEGPIVTDISDPTKSINFILTSATTGKQLTISSSQTQNRTWNVQDASDTFVGRNTTDALTNKDLSDPTNILGNAASGCGLILLNKTTFTNSSTSATVTFTGTKYSKIHIVLSNYLPATSNTLLYLQIRTGSSTVTGSVYYNQQYRMIAAANAQTGDSAVTRWTISPYSDNLSNPDGNENSWDISIRGGDVSTTASSLIHMNYEYSGVNNNNAPESAFGGGLVVTSGATITGIVLTASAGNLKQGTMYTYGWLNA